MSCELDVVFLDRDGTLNHDDGYLADPEGVVLLPGAAEAVALLNRHGVKAVVVTNQSGVARGLFSVETMHATNARLAALLADAGAKIDAWYVCPHHPEDACGCRKPGTELATRAAHDLGVNPARCAMIGDRRTDIEFARRLGGRAVLVLTGEGQNTAAAWDDRTPPDYIANTVYEAVQWLVYSPCGR